MKRILCFGDSNTYGYDAFTGGRFGPDIRWTALAEKALPGRVELVEAGLNGRTCGFDDPYNPVTNGLAALEPTLKRHWPLDGVVLMLGTNDCKDSFHADGRAIAHQMEHLIDTVQRFAAGRGTELPILLIAPVPLSADCSYYEDFSSASKEVSQSLALFYQSLAKRKGISFANAGSWGVELDFDGTHFTPIGHLTFSRNLANILPSVFPNQRPE